MEVNDFQVDISLQSPVITMTMHPCPYNVNCTLPVLSAMTTSLLMGVSYTL